MLFFLSFFPKLCLFISYSSCAFFLLLSSFFISTFLLPFVFLFFFFGGRVYLHFLQILSFYCFFLFYLPSLSSWVCFTSGFFFLVFFSYPELTMNLIKAFLFGLFWLESYFPFSFVAPLSFRVTACLTFLFPEIRKWNCIFTIVLTFDKTVIN